MVRPYMLAPSLDSSAMTRVNFFLQINDELQKAVKRRGHSAALASLADIVAAQEQRNKSSAFAPLAGGGMGGGVGGAAGSGASSNASGSDFFVDEGPPPGQAPFMPMPALMLRRRSS